MNLFYKRSTFYILLLSTIILIVLMFLQGRPLKTAATPAGIISLELAATQEDVDAVLDSWNEASANDGDIIQTAIGNTRLDFAFLISYSLFLFCCAKKLSVHFTRKGRWKIVAGAALTAGMLDVAENIGMLQSLHEKGSDVIAFFTAAAAYFKFILLMFVLLFITAGLIIKIFRKKTATAIIDSAFAS